MALSLGECLLRQQRESKGISQVTLCHKLEERFGITISDTLISKYERGLKFPNPLVSRAICLILGCTEADLYQFIEA